MLTSRRPDATRPDRRPRAGAGRGDRRPAPVARRRAGGPPRATRPSPSSAAASGRRPRVPAAWPRRCEPCRWSWTSPRRPPATSARSRGSSTSPTPSASSPVPCSSRGTGPSGCATWPSGSSGCSPSGWRSPRTRSASPMWASTTSPGSGGVEVGGRDVLPELLAEHGDALAERIELPRALLDGLGVIPSYYLRYFYAHDAVVAEQRRERDPSRRRCRDRTRSCSTHVCRPRARGQARSPRPARRRLLLTGRGRAARVAAGRPTTAAATPLLVNVRNGEHAPLPARRRVIETVCDVAAAGARPLPVPAARPLLAGLVAHVARTTRNWPSTPPSMAVGTASRRCPAGPSAGRPVGSGRAPHRRAPRGQPDVPAVGVGRVTGPPDVVVAVDGGGSKTDVAVAGLDQRRRPWPAPGARCSHHDIGPDRAVRVVDASVTAALAAANLDVDESCMPAAT